MIPSSKGVRGDAGRTEGIRRGSLGQGAIVGKRVWDTSKQSGAYLEAGCLNIIIVAKRKTQTTPVVSILHPVGEGFLPAISSSIGGLTICVRVCVCVCMCVCLSLCVCVCVRW